MKRTLSLLILAGTACDRSGDTRSVTPPPASATSAPAPATSAPVAPATPSSLFRWPKPATVVGQNFTAGIVEHRAVAPEVAQLTEVRAASHDGYDRVVFELGSGLPPGFHLEYVDRPVRKCGSGDVTAVAGDAWLEVRLEPADAHTPTGSPTISERERRLSLPLVKELEQTCDFEAQVVWVIGLAKPNRYRVITLDDPLRLAVDIEH